MSIWTSIQHNYDNKFDVAYSLHGDKIRLTFWNGESEIKCELSINEALGLSEILSRAVKM